jgi:uncharacterized protein (TIGR03083 family)
MDASEVYAEARERVIAVVGGCDAAALERMVPATPAWRVRDVLAHVAGVQADVLAGRMDGVGTDAWGAAQVAARAEIDVAAIAEEWRAGAAAFDPLVKAAPAGMAGALAADVVHHELDLRAALGLPVPAEVVDGPVDFGVNLMAGFLDRRVRKAGLPVLRVQADGQEWTLGAGPDSPAEPAATLVTTPLEFFRLLAGRRSAAQVGALDWSGDPAPYFDVLSAFGPLPAADVPD